jgi:hypothetical protein
MTGKVSAINASAEWCEFCMCVRKEGGMWVGHRLVSNAHPQHFVLPELCAFSLAKVARWMRLLGFDAQVCCSQARGEYSASQKYGIDVSR